MKLTQLERTETELKRLNGGGLKAGWQNHN